MTADSQQIFLSSACANNFVILYSEGICTTGNNTAAKWSAQCEPSNPTQSASWGHSGVHTDFFYTLNLAFLCRQPLRSKFQDSVKLWEVSWGFCCENIPSLFKHLYCFCPVWATRIDSGEPIHINFMYWSVLISRCMAVPMFTPVLPKHIETVFYNLPEVVFRTPSFSI